MIAAHSRCGCFAGERMKSIALALALVFASTTALVPDAAEARRIGGGGAIGMQRSLPPRTPSAQPAQPAAPVAQPGTPATAGAAAAAAPRRSWMGPIAGLAAGLGLAALMSHLGLGAEFANILMILLLGMVAIVAVRYLMRRMNPASATASAGGALFGNAERSERTAPAANAAWGRPADTAPTALAPSAASAAAPLAEPVANLPRDFDTAGFERIAKMIFIRLQAANDSGDLNDLRAFTTPEMFASIKLDLQERGGVAQQTDVVRIDAQVLDVATEADRQVVSVRFHGLIREDSSGGAAPFDEVWHLVKPTDGSREWAIAGIQQMA
jgi:predicted lipid-binding transport protein (Tim44 family)